MGVGDIVFNGVGGAGATSSVSGFDLRISGNTTGTTALVSSGTLTLAGGTNITLSQSGNAITIVGANTGTLSQWWPHPQGNLNRSYGQSTVHVEPTFIPAYVSASAMNLMLTVSLSTSSNSSHAGTLSFAVGIYTKNVSTLSLASSGSTVYSWTNTSDNSSASIQGVKFISIPLAANITPGNYWFGYLSQTASANANWVSLSNVFGGANSNSGSFLSGSTGSANHGFGLGHWSVQTASLPNSMAIADLRNNAAQDGEYQNMTLLNYAP